MRDRPVIIRYFERRSLLDDLVTPGLAEEFAGLRTQYSASADRGRRAALAQFHHLWSTAPEPYHKAEWKKLAEALAQLRIDVAAPPYVCETTGEFRRRLAILSAAEWRQAWHRWGFAVGLALAVVGFGVVGRGAGPGWGFWGGLGWMLALALTRGIQTRRLRELRFQLALFCEHCGSPLTRGRRHSRAEHVLERGTCPSCGEPLLKMP